MLIMGVHSIGHDSAVSFVENGKLIWSIETERLSRVKHDGKIQTTLDYLKEHKADLLQRVDVVSFSTHVSNKVAKIDDFETLNQGIDQHNFYFESKTLITGKSVKCFVVAHEMCHAMVGFQYAKPAEKQLCFVNEGRGHFSRNCVVRRDGKQLTITHCNELPWFGSGMGWTSLAVMMGIEKSPSAAGKVMGMAAYGEYEPRYAEMILAAPHNLYDYSVVERPKFLAKLFKQYIGQPTFKVKANLAATLQQLFAQTVVEHVSHIVTDEDLSVSMSGGCALNLMVNTLLWQRYGERYSVPPVCNDSGQSLGAAIFAQLQLKGHLLEPVSVYSCGESYTVERDWLEKQGFIVEDYTAQKLAKYLHNHEVVAWYQGKSEMGPRALGNRSLFASCQAHGMKDRLNHMVKSREWYRPLAAIVAEESLAKITNDIFPSKYMLFNYDIDSDLIPEATHVDGTSRLQIVSSTDNAKVHELLLAYEKFSGVGALINTSLNGRGKPICLTPEDVINDFADRDVDVYVFGDLIARRGHFV
ncbi:carbamoyltransferase C-terminal domain-containing protein [Pseudoalteromonas sp. M8]|uniref:carbamoyltransferase C-terminal domain-containing protein n=1 Tax=Pseudoalteromonas sp. M8 TaxID=2692624 RepID=UPI001BAC193C|nr:carbamoyltransferase C-terminal domain-containing protein [Pseudoalteromonas sp. M8]QUI71598.1 hypothetical protein GSF13_18435 [Pseudoalteromonas sp. M8]